MSREALENPAAQWRVLDLPLDQVSGVWLASGMRQRGGLFVRAEAVWQVAPA